MTTTKNGKEEVESTIALEHEKIESFIESLEVLCFKRNKSIKQFFDIVYRIAFTAYNKFGLPLENLPRHVKELESDADRLTEEIEEKKLEKQEALEGYDVTLESLEEYMENRPLFETNEKLLGSLFSTYVVCISNFVNSTL
jgi:phenylalanyl-tRNA synthetase alpha subunit